MSYKPDERDFMAYLYNEMEGQEKDKFERYLLRDRSLPHSNFANEALQSTFNQQVQRAVAGWMSM